MRRIVALALAAAALGRPLSAQVPDLPDVSTDFPSEFAAHFAITSTPIGLLPSAISLVPAPGARRGIGFRAQFGRIKDGGLGPSGPFDISRSIVAGGVDIPLGTGTLGITAGRLDYGCDELSEQVDFDGDGVTDFTLSAGCKSGMSGSVSWSMPLVRSAVGATGTTSVLIGLDGAVGLSSGDLIRVGISGGGFPGSLGVTVTSSTQVAALGLPVGLQVRSGGVTVVPHVTPRLAFGRTKLDAPALSGTGEQTDVSDTGLRFMAGGGLALLFEGSGVGINVGIQKVFVDGGKVAFGAGLSYAMR